MNTSDQKSGQQSVHGVAARYDFRCDYCFGCSDEDPADKVIESFAAAAAEEEKKEETDVGPKELSWPEPSEQVTMLMGAGFERHPVEYCLLQHDGNPDLALAMLLRGQKLDRGDDLYLPSEQDLIKQITGQGYSGSDLLTKQQQVSKAAEALNARKDEYDALVGAEADHSDRVPLVVFSYCSNDVEFMKKLRTYLNRNGIATVDGAP